MQYPTYTRMPSSRIGKAVNPLWALFMILTSQILFNGQAIASSNSNTYTREATLPYFSSAYYPPIAGSTQYLGMSYINPVAVPTGISLPPELLQDMQNGEIVRVKVLIPPGTEYANFTVDTGQAGGNSWGVFTKDLPYCPSQPSNGAQTCISSSDLNSPTLISGTLYPTRGVTGTNSTAQYAYIVLRAGFQGFRWAVVTINININDPTQYNQWRGNRSWAGGSGDTDGLGGNSSSDGPAVPSGLFATAASSSSINLTWNASTQQGGTNVNAYRVYRFGALVATLGNVTNFSDVGLNAATNYSYTLAACDATGNCSAQSSPATATTATVSNCSYAISRNNFSSSLPATQSTSNYKLDVLSNCSWSATTDNSWIHLSTNSGSGNGSVEFSLDANATASSRTAQVRAGTATIGVTQSAASTFTLTVTPQNRQVEAGASYTLSANLMAIDRCTSSDTKVFTTPQPQFIPFAAGGTAVATAAPLASATLTCYTLTNESASVTMTIAKPPTVIAISNQTDTAATVTVTSPVAVKGYFKVQSADSATAPSSSEIKADASNVAPAIPAKTATKFSLTLVPNTTNKVFFYAEDATDSTKTLSEATITLITYPDKSLLSVVAGGTDAYPNITANFTPVSTSTKNLYVAAWVPAKKIPPGGGVYFLTNTQLSNLAAVAQSSVWTPYNGTLIPYPSPGSAAISVLDGQLDVSSLSGTVIFAAYGTDRGFTSDIIYSIK